MDILSEGLGTITGWMKGLWPQPAETPHLVQGKLRPLAGTPNGVSSESTNVIVRIEPLGFKGSPASAWAILKGVVQEHGGVVHEAGSNYLWSTFTVPLFGFVDDVEFRLSPEEGVIHVRSSSRLGFSDLGVNRGRVETLRAAFQKALAG